MKLLKINNMKMDLFYTEWVKSKLNKLIAVEFEHIW